MMKFILLPIFILVGFFASAQKIIITQDDFLPRNHDTLFTQSNVETSRVILYADIFLYAKKCYNDSAARYYYILCDNGCWEVPCIKGQRDEFRHLCPEHWEHMRPTFEGFIEYIKQYKK